MKSDIALLKKEIEAGFSSQNQEDLELANSDYLTLVEESE